MVSWKEKTFLKSKQSHSIDLQIHLESWLLSVFILFTLLFFFLFYLFIYLFLKKSNSVCWIEWVLH